MKKKLLAALLTAILLLSLLPVPALADTPDFGWRFVYYDAAGTPSCDTTSTLETAITLSPGSAHHMGFFLHDSLCIPSDIRVTDGQIASVEQAAEGYYIVEALDFGETTLEVVAGSEKYELPLSVILPSSGFASSDILTRETYLSSFTFDGNTRSFYCITDQDLGEDPEISLTLDSEATSLVTWSQVGNRAIELTVAEHASFQSAWLFLEIQHPNGPVEGHGIGLYNGTPRLVFCPVDWYYGDSYRIPEGGPWAMDLSFTPGFSMTGVFGSMTGNEITLLAPHSVHVTSDDAASVIQSGTVVYNGSPYPVYTLCTVHVGNATLQVDDFTTALRVALPAYGFYTSQTFNEGTYLSQCNYFENSTIWLLTEGGFTAEQKTAVSVEAEQRTVQLEWVERQNGGYDLKIILPKPTDDRDDYSLIAKEGSSIIGSLWVMAQPENTPAYFTLGGKTYGVGFSYERDGIMSIFEGTMCSGYTTSAPRTGQRVGWGSLPVEAGLQIIDENLGVYYDADKASPVSIQVNSLRIEPVFGAKDTFSWSATEDVKTTDNPNAILYCFEGADATALIWANVTCRVGGETYTRDVSCITEVIYQAEEIVYWPHVEDTAELNKKLQTLAAAASETSITQLFLGYNTDGTQSAPMTFEGTVEIPAAFQGDKQLILHGGNVTIQGSLDLNGARVISIDGIDFEGNKAQGSRAIYGSTCGTIENCSFTGYDVALASDQDGNLNPIGCIFEDNRVAASVDVKALQWVMSLNTWNGNLFLHNDTAVEIRSFNAFLSPYQFRIINSDFLDNDLDFRVDCAATLYFYQNFYGRLTDSGDVADAKHAPPTVECDHSITKVITNPRWKDPVLVWQEPVQAFALLAAPAETNYLTADWDLPTEIVNEEADGLTLDAAAFREPGQKTIDVVNQEAQFLGTWTFDGVSEVETGIFQAGFTVIPGENNITVIIRESEMLDAAPTLSIPCGYSYAQAAWGDVTFSAAVKDGLFTFPVTRAGTYTITEAKAPAGEPERPEMSKPCVPSKPQAPTETELPAFTDVPAAAWYAEAVDYVAEAGIMTGTGSGKFSPELPVTRAILMTLLARLAGVNTDGGKTWYEKGLVWAVETGISDGSDPAGVITREQLVTMLYRQAGSSAVDGVLTGFADTAAISAWAKAAMTWAVQSGLLNGIDGALAPQGSATRAQVAVILQRLGTGMTPPQIVITPR